MTRYFILLFSIFISTLVVSSQIPDNDPELLKAKGDNYLIENSYDSAVLYYNRAATGFLREADIKQYLYCKNQEAYTLGFQNKNLEALRICENIIEEYPDSLQAYRLDIYFFWKMALFSVRIGNFDVAYTYGVKTKETAESYSIFEGYMLNDVLDILTTSTRYIGLYDIGLEYALEKIKYCQSVGDYLNLSHSYNNIALIYKRLYDHNRALEYFIRCMELRERYAPQWTPYVTTNIGEMYQEIGQSDSALTWFQNTLRILKEQGVRENLLYSVVYSSISVAMAKEGNYDSAKVYFQSAINEDTKNGDYVRWLANAVRQSKQYDEAIAYYKQALTLNPEDGLAWNGIGQCYDHKGVTDKACKAWNKGAQLGSYFAEANLLEFCNKR